MCDHTWSALSAEFGSTGYGYQSCLWSAEQVKMIFSLSPFTREILVSRDGFSRPVPRQPAYSPHSAESGAYSRDFLVFGDGAHLLIYHQPPSGQSRVLSCQAIAYRWRSMSKRRRCRASSPQGSSSNECCLSRFYHGPIVMHHTYIILVDLRMDFLFENTLLSGHQNK